MRLLYRRIVEVLICLPAWYLLISQHAIADCVDSGTFENPSGIINCIGTSTGPFVDMSNYHLVDFIDVTVHEGATTGVMGFGMDHNGALVNNGVIVGTEIRPLQPTSLSIIGDWMLENNGLIGYSGERLVSPRGSPVSGAGSAIQLFGGNTVINRGQIITTPNAELAEGIFALPLVTIWNTETGLIEAGGFRSDAIAAIGIPDPDDPATFGSIVNDGSIVTTGDSSSAINLLWQGDILNNGEVIADGLRSNGIVMTGGSFGEFFMEKIDDVSGNIIEQVVGPTPTIQGILSYYQDLDIPDSWFLLPDEQYAVGSITNNGSVRVTGDDIEGSALGIAILGTQNGMIANSGTVAVSGMNAVGLGLFGQGTITHEQNGAIVAIGLQAEGISAEAFEETDVINIESSGNISVEGEEWVVGIGVTADNARVSLAGPGGITATGTLSTGIEVLGDGAVISSFGGTTNQVTRAIDVEGEETAGIWVTGDNAKIVTGGGGIRATGNFAVGIGLEGDYANVSNPGLITVSGLNSDGIGIDGDGCADAADCRIENSGTISTRGNHSDGIAVSGNNQHIINSGQIFTRNSGAEGILLEALKGGNILNEGAIETNGPDAKGIQALGDDITILNASGALISTASSGGHGIMLGLPGQVAQNVDINNAGIIDTAGEGASGVLAFVGGESTFMNTGRISVIGKDAVAASVLGGGSKVVNESLMESGSLDIATDEAVQPPDPNNPPEGRVGIYFEGKTTLENRFGAELQVFGENAAAIRSRDGGDSSSLSNDGVIIAFGKNAAGVDVKGDNADITNAGIIETTGEGGSGVLALVGGESTFMNTGRISVIGKDAVAASVLGGGSTVVNEGLMESGSLDIATDEAAQPPDPNNPPEGRVGIYFEGKTTLENRLDAKLQAYGENAAAIRSHDGGESSSLSNDGVIIAFGKNAAGVDIKGDNVTFTNVSDARESLFTEALIGVEGENAAGVKTRGAGAFISSRETETEEGVATTSIEVTGDNAVGIDATATGSGGFLIENAGKLIANGVNAIGMALRNATEGALDLILASGSSACAGGAKGAALSNCGEVVVSGDNSVGLLAEGINDSSVINFGAVTAGGESAVNAVAIKLDDGQGGAGADNNFVLNIADATASGENAKGVSINGDNNLFVQGNDALVLPVAPNTFTSVQAFIDKVEARTGPGGSNETEVFPLGGVRATGDNAVGVYVEGNNNIIGVPVGLSDFDPTGDTPGLPTAPKIASIIATGTGSIGVQLDGNVNTLSNFGIVSGEQFSVLGGDGVDIVIAAGAFDGAIDLGDGMDEFNLLGGTEGMPFEGLEIEKFNSVIDGGGGIDVLRIIDSNFFGGDSSSSGLPDGWLGFGDESIDSDRILNFEFFDVEVDGRVTLANTLDVFQVSVLDGDLHLDDATILADEIIISVFGELSGEGVVSTAPRVDNPDGLKGDIELLGGGIISPGDSPGILTLESNFSFGGTLEIELAGLDENLFDQLIVDGDMTIDGGILDILLLDDFAPEVGDTFEFLTVTGDVTGLDTLQLMATNAAADIDFDLSLMALTGGGFKIDLITMAADFDMSEVPLPATWLLFLTGLGGAVWLRRQRREEEHLAPRRAALSD